MTDLTQALAELRQMELTYGQLWTAREVMQTQNADNCKSIATTLNAALSGDLIPKADADLAVALMVEPLLKRREGIEADIRSAHHGRGDGASSAMREDDRDFRAAVAAAFDALVPASALAELQALRADRDRLDAATNTLSEMWEGEKARAEAAEARNAELEALIRGKTFTVDESVELKAENERLRTPQGAAKVLLTISDVEIKPAAKALQDAFNLKGIGWKRYLSALRAAITALQVKP